MTERKEREVGLYTAECSNRDGSWSLILFDALLAGHTASNVQAAAEVKPVKSLGRWPDTALSDGEQIPGLRQQFVNDVRT